MMLQVCPFDGAVADIVQAATAWLPVFRSGIGDLAEDDPPMAVFMMLFAAAFLGAVIAGFLLLVVIALSLMAAVGAGIFGLSLYSALRARSLSRGFRTLCIASGAVCGIPISLLLSFLFAHVIALDLDLAAWVIAAMGGAFAGAFLGWILFAGFKLFLRAMNDRITAARRG